MHASFCQKIKIFKSDLSLSLNTFHTFFLCFYCWLLADKCFLGSCNDSFILRNMQVLRGSCFCFCSFPVPWGEALILALYLQLFFYLLYTSNLRKPNEVICFLVKYIFRVKDQRFVSGIEASFPTYFCISNSILHFHDRSMITEKKLQIPEKRLQFWK